MNKLITIKTLCIIARFNFERRGSWAPGRRPGCTPSREACIHVDMIERL